MADPNPFDQFDAATTPNPFDQFDRPAPHTLAETAADVAKSGGVGLAKGAISVPGMVGDLQALAGKFNPYTWLGEHLAENHPELARVLMSAGGIMNPLAPMVTTSDYGKAPTSRDIQHGVEGYTGQFYEPQTRPGRYAETAGSFVVPALLTGGESIPGTIAKGAVIPGITSEAAGELTQGTPWETPARLIGGAAGGGLAHLGQMGANAAATRNAAGNAADEIGRLVGDPNMTPGAVREIGRAVRQDELTPAMAALRMDRLGPEGMLIDAGGPYGSQLREHAAGVANQPGVGQRRLLDATMERTGSLDEAHASPGEYQGPSAERIKGTLNTEMGAPPDVVAARDAIMATSRAHARPLYDAVMNAHPVVDMPADITSRPAIAAAMGDARNLARNYGENLSTTTTRTRLNAAGVPVTETVEVPGQTSLHYWDYVKKGLDQRINGMMRNGFDALNSQDKADLGGLMSARRALVDHLDSVTDGEYANARRVWSTGPELTNAMDQGRDALRSGLLPEEMHEIYGDLSIPAQSMFRMGMRREIDHVIDAAGNDAAKARALLRTNQNYNKIADVFGNDTADEVRRRIMAESNFQDVTNDIAQNSKTARRLMASQATAPPNSVAAPSANPIHWVTSPVMKWYNAGREAGLERDRAAMASMLTAPSDQVPDLVRILAGYNTRAAGLASPPISPLARSLAAVGAVNGVNLANSPERGR